MSFSTDWNIDSYRTTHECNEHWDLRKSFMEAHKESFPEDKLVCLAQVFTNVEFLGCRYPEQTMKLVAELSSNIAADFREKQKSKLQRTFVKASDAAGAKAKGRTNNTATQKSTTPKQLNDNLECNKPAKRQRTDKIVPQPKLNHYRSFSTGPNLSINDGAPSGFDPSQTVLAEPNVPWGGVAYGNTSVPGNVEVKSLGLWPELVVVDRGEDIMDNNFRTLEMSAAACQMPLQWTFTGSDGVATCRVSLKNEFLAEGTGINKKLAKVDTVNKAIETLKETCYTIKVKHRFISDTTIDKSLKGHKANDGALTQDNVGSKLMRLMGWSGEGLGKQQQGIKEPISVNLISGRTGLGAMDYRQFRSKVEGILTEYIQGKMGENDLAFSSDFSHQERKFMHRIAKKLNLQSKSFGKDDKRHIVISQKVKPMEIVQDLLNGLNEDKYELIPPKQLIS